MKYQVLKHLKTKSKLIKLCDTAYEAKKLLENELGARFSEFSYMGGFPVFVDGYTTYSVQGLNEQYGVVVSLSGEDRAVF